MVDPGRSNSDPGSTFNFSSDPDPNVVIFVEQCSVHLYNSYLTHFMFIVQPPDKALIRLAFVQWNQSPVSYRSQRNKNQIWRPLINNPNNGHNETSCKQCYKMRGGV